MEMISAERWMVDHITQKNVYIKWLKQKKTDVSEFLIDMDNIGYVLQNLKLIFNKKCIDEFPLINNLSYQIKEFSTRIKLKEQDVYKELRDYTFNKYKDANLELIEIEGNDVEIKEDIKDDPYYKYKSIFRTKKVEYLD